jgi:hypothetical protein
MVVVVVVPQVYRRHLSSLDAMLDTLFLTVMARFEQRARAPGAPPPPSVTSPPVAPSGPPSHWDSKPLGAAPPLPSEAATVLADGAAASVPGPVPAFGSPTPRFSCGAVAGSSHYHCPRGAGLSARHPEPTPDDLLVAAVADSMGEFAAAATPSALLEESRAVTGANGVCGVLAVPAVELDKQQEDLALLLVLLWQRWQVGAADAVRSLEVADAVAQKLHLWLAVSHREVSQLLSCLKRWVCCCCGRVGCPLSSCAGQCPWVGPLMLFCACVFVVAAPFNLSPSVHNRTWWWSARAHCARVRLSACMAARSPNPCVCGVYARWAFAADRAVPAFHASQSAILWSSLVVTREGMGPLATVGGLDWEELVLRLQLTATGARLAPGFMEPPLLSVAGASQVWPTSQLRALRPLHRRPRTLTRRWCGTF